MSVLTYFRRPEYTGKNRCVPCTIVNLVLAVISSLVLAIFSRVLGSGMLIASLGMIYFRGYLIPKTPTLTKQYFPESVLRWFDKDTADPITDEDIDINPEEILISAEVVESCSDAADLCLNEDFQQDWRERARIVRSDNLGEEQLIDAIDGTNSGDGITVKQQEGVFIAYTDDFILDQWSSKAAVIADVASARELSERLPQWSAYSTTERIRILMSLRLFVERCPDCGGLVQVKEEAVESCCRSYDVVASTCQECGSRLFEMEWSGFGEENKRRAEEPV